MARAAETDCDVVIVGAGLSGLVAAHRLTVAGLQVVVLEARDRVGGRMLNVPVSETEIVEMGGQFIGPGHTRMLALLDELGIPTFRTYNEGHHVSEWGGELLRYRRVPRVSLLGLVDAGQAIWRLDRAAREIPLERPWIARRAHKWDAETAATWIHRTAVTHFGRTTLRLFLQGLFSCEPESLSALHLLTCVQAGGGFKAMASTEKGAQERRIVGGSQTICKVLAERLGDSVRLSSPVRRIDWQHEGLHAYADDVKVTARRAVLALPAALVGRIDYRPALPIERDQLTQRLPQGNVIKCMAIYDRPWWRDEGLSGHASSDGGAVAATYDGSPPSASVGVLVAFVEGRRAQQLGRLSPERRRQSVVDCLVRFFGARARRLEGWREIDWSAEEWSRGCYGAHLPPGVWTQFGPAMRQSVGPMHWAGSETATRWPGYMDGAIESGQRTAVEVVRALGAC